MKSILSPLIFLLTFSFAQAKTAAPQKAVDIIKNKNVIVIDVSVTKAHKDGSVSIKINEALKGVFRTNSLKTVVSGCIGRKASGYLKSGKRYLLIATGDGDSLFCDAIWEVSKDAKGNLVVNYFNIFKDEVNPPFPKVRGLVPLKKLKECVAKVKH
jgi:hypothetical protein